MAREHIPDHERARHLDLTAGLVGPHATLYNESANFRHGIDTLAGWLPAWVAGMADIARAADAALAQAVDLAEHTASATIILSPEAAAQLAHHGLNLSAADLAAARQRADRSRRLRDEYQAQVVEPPHCYVVDDDGAPCCPLPMDHWTHDVHAQTVNVDQAGRHRYERGPSGRCNISTCRQPSTAPVHITVRQADLQEEPTAHLYEPGPDELCNVTSCRRPEGNEVHKHRPTCPDGGRCHHECTQLCWRVNSCGPLSGVFPGDVWPAEIAEANAPRPHPRTVPHAYSGSGPCQVGAGIGMGACGLGPFARIHNVTVVTSGETPDPEDTPT